MGFLGWIVIGAVAGWIASMVTGENAQMGAVANIFVGIIGAFIGGIVMNIFGGIGITGFNFWSLFVAVIGSIILLWIINAATTHHRHQ